LQAGVPDNDLLVYYPIYDVWNDPGELIRPNPVPKSLTNVVMSLWEKGYSFDYVSDRFLAKAECKDHNILLGGNEYNAIVVPECQVMPVATLSRLLELANFGATIIFPGHVPSDVPGFGKLEASRAQFYRLGDWNLKHAQETLNERPIGNGRLLFNLDLGTLLQMSGAKQEPAAQFGLRFVRRKTSDGFLYFLANRSDGAMDKYVPIATILETAVIFDPRFQDRMGLAEVHHGRALVPQVLPTDFGEETGSIRLQLQPGESCFVRTFTNKVIKGPSWLYVTNAGPTQEITGIWQVDFIEGEPKISTKIDVHELKSWTSFDLAELKSFAGTGRYIITFEWPEGKADDWMLDLGKVCESARVKLNGHQLGALWCAPFRETVGEWLKPGKNTLEVEVTNLAANRIADFDRRKVKWKYFYDINMASKRYRSLDASEWPLFDSGLLGPVTLTPLKKTAVN
jgi:hypothetical protein